MHIFLTRSAIGVTLPEAVSVGLKTTLPSTPGAVNVRAVLERNLPGDDITRDLIVSADYMHN